VSATEQRGFDLDEDLFDFASVARKPTPEEPSEDLDEIFASFRAPAPAADEAPAAPETREVVTPRVEPARHAASAAIAPRAAPPALNVDLGRPLEGAPPAQQRSRRAVPAISARGVVVVAAAVTLLNSVAAVIVLRGRSGAGESAAGAVHEAQAASEERPVVEHAPGADLPEPDGVKPLHGHPALDLAREHIASGEYGAARQGVYGLLATIDRLEEPRRSDLEADCQYLIAQSLHLEALARMGEVR
jgi:hypothetical protein